MPSPEASAAAAHFWRMITIIAIGGVLLVIGVLWWLSRAGPLQLHMVIATTLGVFISVLLGCGLFSLAFFSDRSGHDQDVTDASQPHDWDRRP